MQLDPPLKETRRLEFASSFSELQSLRENGYNNFWKKEGITCISVELVIKYNLKGEKYV